MHGICNPITGNVGLHTGATGNQLSVFEVCIVFIGYFPGLLMLHFIDFTGLDAIQRLFSFKSIPLKI